MTRTKKERKEEQAMQRTVLIHSDVCMYVYVYINEDLPAA
jgi:hypothetical protein